VHGFIKAPLGCAVPLVHIDKAVALGAPFCVDIAAVGEETEINTPVMVITRCIGEFTGANIRDIFRLDPDTDFIPLTPFNGIGLGVVNKFTLACGGIGILIKKDGVIAAVRALLHERKHFY
jgi:hypothetical protein